MPRQSPSNVLRIITFPGSLDARRSRAKDLSVATQGNRTRVHLHSHPQRFTSADLRHRDSGIPQKCHRGSLIPRCGVYLDQTDGRKNAALPAQPGGPQGRTGHRTEGRLAGKSRRVGSGPGAEGLVVRRNHLASPVSRGLASTAGGNLSYGNLGLLHSWIIRARV